MKLKYLCYTLLILVLLSFYQGCLIDETNEKIDLQKNSYYVDVDGKLDFKTIQGAIDAAQEKSTIFINNGHYNENIKINKSLSIIGENPKKTVIDGSITNNTIFINDDNVELSNCTIVNSGRNSGYAGIHISSDYVEIKGNIISNNTIGIYTKEARYNLFHNNTIKSNLEYGLYVGPYSDFMIIRDNIFFKNDCSLRIKGSDHCELFRNQFNNSNKGLFLCCGASFNTMYHNTFLNHTRWNANDLVGSNYWNNTNSEGNYWDDYDGVDENNDGIGDSRHIISTYQYNISTNIKIYYLFPLMNQYI